MTSLIEFELKDNLCLVLKDTTAKLKQLTERTEIRFSSTAELKTILLNLALEATEHNITCEAFLSIFTNYTLCLVSETTDTQLNANVRTPETVINCTDRFTLLDLADISTLVTLPLVTALTHVITASILESIDYTTLEDLEFVK